MKCWDDLRKEIIETELCTFCGTCIGACPQNNIYSEDEKIMGDDHCSSCGLCYDICPGKNFDFPHFNKHIFSSDYDTIDNDLGHYNKILRGYCTDKQLRDKSSSGGVVTGLLIYLINSKKIDGAIVVTTDKEHPTRTKVIVAKTEMEIREAAQSRYTLTDTNAILKQLKRIEGKYAYVGLPCQVQGMRKLSERVKSINNKIFLYIGLFCGFNISYEGTRYLLNKLNLEESQVESLSYRGGTGTGGFLVKSKDKKEYFIEKHAYTYINMLFSPKRCWLCYDLTSEFADISIGDAWEKKNDAGWSRIFARSNKGVSLIQECIENGWIYAEECSKDVLYTTQSQLINYKKRGYWLRRKLVKHVPDYNIVKKTNIDSRLLEDLVFYMMLRLGKVDYIRKIIQVIPNQYISALSMFGRTIFKGRKHETKQDY
ncbi:Coenzyme F420 hydrogenase/dehydrogenase, beta subunit C-terminal domain [Geosporobacter ferrireducens]|uniref:Coenzyme F420 hydrogenase/dehydrogenase, beta subunit C-terminal domain n=1 Tax=Geosporobacter ferrireducens TaxID=1424294 RepID=UPI00139C1C96|nr:Coenzyme F420 hydrogenase/dehydrogenase, beta subunit C-terminal domain [Geosporobacter ferrireducens]MTI53325.1 4Fe-4S dicluster domain-containing protein [Geosporobacter ferrireducens]